LIRPVGEGGAVTDAQGCLVEVALALPGAIETATPGLTGVAVGDFDIRLVAGSR
jgi:hypothetical protein